MRHRNSRGIAAAFTVVMLFLGGCEGEGGVSEDPQGPADNAPGTQGPQATPDGG